MRQPSLRQIEALMAVVETGSVSRAALMLRISQPAASKLIAHLEEDAGMQLFERSSGRLVPTERGMRLYEEADRIFGSVDQVARAVDRIRREEKGQLLVGVMPGLAGPFMARVLRGFRERYPDVFVSVETRSSQFLADWLVSRRLDIGFLITRVEHETIRTEPVKNPPMICLLPMGHRLAAKKVVRPKDLEGEPFIGFGVTSLTRRRINAAFETEGYFPNIVLDATTGQNVCEFVANGFGVTVTDALVAEIALGRVEVRRFEPEIKSDLHISWPTHSRKSELVEAFAEEFHNAVDTLPSAFANPG
ncbi:LysR substrate-binding domain-containing protein [Salipiger mucosus]|uniref:Transcriptional regulator, LysR family n=1 Tax=Salipiger mucosus DSM 16094 TaxID=1123237 RepID=S9QLS4_9RHOB|nr:LysR substrate-binding domain-containing protein [Salipiger mucosus]EPX80533.1 transcriptional regulator, LysR family [Salipiger mucosus DSM 16094]